MEKIYKSPFRVYLVLFVLALVGINSGLNLPISLYPNSSKPTIWASVNYGSLTAEEFLDNYGDRIEPQLQNISTNKLEVEKLVSDYSTSRASYQVEFKWGADPKESLKEVQSVMNSLSASWPKEIRNSLNVSFWSKSSGFIAISFFSEERSLNNLYDMLEPVLTPKLAKVQDAENPSLWNPNKKEVRIVLDPETMATLNLFPKDVENAIKRGLNGYKGGSVVVGTNKLNIQMPRELDNIDKLNELLVPTKSGQLVHLSEIARIEFGNATGQNRIFKTNGSKSLILFANPKTGGNVKRMAEEILSIVKKALPALPKDIQHRVLVDPSEFIRASVQNVIHEVALAAGLAVLVIFLFIGSFKNTVTAALEIPLSMILAFVLMKLFNMNLNLISLGGLALAAGMNVDASVVVMENIFRHLDKAKGPLNPELRLKLILRAVREVKFPIIASTISTLVVFTPLAFTSALTNAILGDLAKAVVFSHAFSMFIALLLVPTIRLQIMNRSKDGDSLPKAPLDSVLKKVERLYAKALRGFITSKYVKWVAISLIPISIVVMITTIIPTLKREVIGTPDTDWIILGVNTSGNTNIQQMETEASKAEADLLDKFGKDIKYTFTQIRGANRASIMARLDNKKDMDRVWKAMQEHFQNTPVLYYWVVPWNPAELPIPNPPQMRLLVRGGDVGDRNLIAESLINKLQEKEPFPRTWSEPSVNRRENIELVPDISRWQELRKAGGTFLPFDITDLARVATEGRGIDNLSVNGKSFPMKISYPKGTVLTKEDLESMPIGVGNKLIPLKAIVDVKLKKAKPQIYRENGRSLIIIQAKQNKGNENLAEASLAKAKIIVENFRKEDLGALALKTSPSFYFEDALKELNSALSQLGVALAMSLLLILFTLLLQFGNLIHSAIIMVAVPLGVFGGTLSLWIFDSSLSLNSALGIILLNGVAVNNSIILVDFLNQKIKDGMNPVEAAVMAGRNRLRPILITSLTTILGMLPIALGTGEGGKILQPLGLTVAGGLWFSTLFTLFFVPMFETLYWNTKWKKMKFDKPIIEDNVLEETPTITIENNKDDSESPVWQ